MMNFIASDTETGGLVPHLHALLSIGACCSWSAETFTGYITVESQPGKIVEKEAALKNGYSLSLWQERRAEPLEWVISAFLEWIEARKKEKPDAVLVCHHLAFDKGFYNEAGRVVGREMPHRNHWVCSQNKLTEMMAQSKVPKGSSNLNRLMHLSGWPVLRSDAHDALQDALICAHGYRWLLRKDGEAEFELSALAALRLEKLRGIEDAMGQLAVWYENGSATGRPMHALIEEMTCLAKAHADDLRPLPRLTGARLIAMERMRQIMSERWTPDNDDKYVNGELRDAGIAYAMVCDDSAGENAADVWPWEVDWWKPSEQHVRNLVKAGALLSAEIDRLLRKEGATHG